MTTQNVKLLTIAGRAMVMLLYLVVPVWLSIIHKIDIGGLYNVSAYAISLLTVLLIGEEIIVRLWRS
jgi:hypothetical protein